MENSVFRQQIANMGLSKPDAYSPYAAGSKVYGPEGRAHPTSGPVDSAGMMGYAKRDSQVAAKKSAILARLQAAQKGQYLTPEYLAGGNNGI